MNTVQRIAKNTGVLVISQMVSRIFSFFYVMYTARYLGAEGFGILSLALAFTGIFGVFTDLGLGSLTVREVVRDKSLVGKYLNNITVIKIILVTFTFGLIALAVNVLGYPEQTTKVVYLIALSVIFSAFTIMFYSIFQAFEKMEYQSLGQILESILMFSGIMLAIKYNFTIIGFASLYLIASIIVLGYSFVVLRWRFFNPIFVGSPRKIEIDWRFWKSTIKAALPFGLSGIFITIYYHMDTVMLSLMIPNANEIVGWYNAAYKIIFVLMSIPQIYVIVIFPIMSRFFKTSEKSLKFIFNRSIRYIVLISIPIVAGITLLSDRIILLVFGSDYVPSIIVLQILVWSFFFAAIGGVFGYLLNSINRQATLSKIVGCGMVLNLILNALLIPNYSYIGASIATDLTRFFVIFTEFIILAKIGFNLGNKRFLGGILKIIISSLIMIVFIKYLRDTNLLLLIISSALLYFTTLYLLKGLDKDDISLLRRLFDLENGS